MVKRRGGWLAVATALGLVTASGLAIAALGDNSVGMNAHDGIQEFVDACADLGVKWIRLDGNWRDLEPSNDSY
jgi:hypothetical protein